MDHYKNNYKRDGQSYYYRYSSPGSEFTEPNHKYNHRNAFKNSEYDIKNYNKFVDEYEGESQIFLQKPDINNDENSVAKVEYAQSFDYKCDSSEEKKLLNDYMNNFVNKTDINDKKKYMKELVEKEFQMSHDAMNYNYFTHHYDNKNTKLNARYLGFGSAMEHNVESRYNLIEMQLLFEEEVINNHKNQKNIKVYRGNENNTWQVLDESYSKYNRRKAQKEVGDYTRIPNKLPNSIPDQSEGLIKYKEDVIDYEKNNKPKDTFKYPIYSDFEK